MKEKLYANFVIGIVSIFVAFLMAIIIAKFATLSIAMIPVLILGAFLTYFIIRRPELGWLLIIFFLPFERVPTVAFGGVDIKINTILGFITLIAWILALMFNAKKYKVQPYVIAIPIILFILAMLLSLTDAGAFTRGLMVLFFILFTILLSVLAVNMLSDKEQLKKTLIVLFASSFIVGVFGLFQFGGDTVGLPQSLTLLKQGYTKVVFGFPRVQAFSMEPLYLANYLLIPIFVGIALFFNKTGPVPRWTLAGLLALLILIFVLTVSRGGYLGFIGAFAVSAILMFRQVLTWKNILIGLLTIVVVGYGVAFALSKGDYRATNEFIGHVTLGDLNRGESIQGRLATFRRAMQAYVESPIIGVGIGNYGPWNKFYPDATPKIGWDIVNNQYIELLAETGIVGVSAFGLIIIVLIWRTFSALKKAKDIFLKSVLIGFFAALVGVLIQYNFMSTLYIIHIWVLIGLLVGVQNLIFKEQKA
ncbi:MAG: O-antigen polymerase [Candidatus Berkelbacteria bacterium]|nr:O-antigen polymerase [Candidatus Berkelbacteria bacterium]